MNEKYLPIGSVVKFKDNMVMIVGYKIAKYTDEIKVFDYEGIAYPTGTLSENKYYFNHDDIEELLSTGFVTPEYTQLNQKLAGKQEEIKTPDENVFDNIENIIPTIEMLDLDDLEGVTHKEEDVLPENQDADIPPEIEETVNVDIPVYRFTEDGIIIK